MTTTMRNIQKTLLALIPLSLSAVSANAAGLSRYELEVKDFSELKVIEGINVDYKSDPDSAGRAVFTATAEQAQLLMFTNKKECLEVQLATTGAGAKDLPTVTVYSNYLTKVENTGDSTVRILNIGAGPKFKARLVGNGRLIVRDIKATQVEGSIETGNGQMVIYGKCQTAKLSSTGTGSIQADDLEATDVSIKSWGTGSIGCNVNSGNLSIVGAGSGKVYYKGKPSSIKNRSVGVKAVALTTDASSGALKESDE